MIEIHIVALALSFMITLISTLVLAAVLLLCPHRAKTFSFQRYSMFVDFKFTLSLQKM